MLTQVVVGCVMAAATSMGAGTADVVDHAGPEALKWFVGDWEGEGKYFRGPEGAELVVVTERAEWALGNSTVLVQGLGVAATNPERVVHEAIGVIRVDQKSGKIIMHAFKANSEPVETELEQTDENTFRWGFEPSPGQRVRFTTDFTETTWTEVGEFSRGEDGPWFKFFEMNLERVQQDDR